MKRLALSLVFMMLHIAFVRSGGPAKPHDIIDSALRAGGGIERISKVRAISLKVIGKSIPQDGFADMKISGLLKDAEHFRFEIDNGSKTNDVFVANGGKAWYKVAGDAKPDQMPEAEFREVADFFHAVCMPDLLIALKRKEVAMSLLPEEKVNGKTAVGLLVKQAKRQDVRLFFDKESALPIKSQVNMKNPIEETHVYEFFYSDYMEQKSIKHFTRIKLQQNGKVTREFHITEWKLLETIDAGAFDMP